MQNPKIDDKKLSEMIIDEWDKAEQTQENALEYNKITKTENLLKIPTECGVDLAKF